MKKFRFGVLPFGLLLLSTILGSTPAWALFDNYGLDPSYCNQPTIRTTVVYIDDMMMVDGHTEWATQLATKLRATLTPGERVSVVRLMSGTGQSREYWSGCWPEFPAAKKAKLRKQTYWFQENPVDKIEDQKKYFVRDLGAALTKIYMEAKRPAKDVSFSAEDPPAKQILRALASDEGRFSNSTQTIRAIMYSDLAENSDLGSAFRPLPTEPLEFGKRLGTYLHGGVFYDYGMGETIKDDPAFSEMARRFWTGALSSMAAVTVGLGGDLTVPNTMPIRAYALPAMLDRRDQRFDGRFSLLVGESGDLVDSWLGIRRLGASALSGTVKCANGEGRGCRLEAETASGIATDAPTESVRLMGDIGSMHGTLGAGDTTFALMTMTAAQQLKLNVEYVPERAAAPPPNAAPAPAYTVPPTAPAPAAAPPPAPAAVPATVRPPAAPAAQPMSPAQQAASATQAYAEGRADRVAWRTWFNAQSGSARLGAEYWAAVRNKAHPAPCTAVNRDPAFVSGCEGAQQRLAPIDVRRKTEANYWWGWNSV